MIRNKTQIAPQYDFHCSSMRKYVAHGNHNSPMHRPDTLVPSRVDCCMYCAMFLPTSWLTGLNYHHVSGMFGRSMTLLGHYHLRDAARQKRPPHTMISHRIAWLGTARARTGANLPRSWRNGPTERRMMAQMTTAECIYYSSATERKCPRFHSNAFHAVGNGRKKDQVPILPWWVASNNGTNAIVAKE